MTKLNVSKYEVDRDGGDYAFLFADLYDAEGNLLTPSKIQTGPQVNYTIGAISNLTGALKDTLMSVGPNNALYVSGNVELGQTGTFDLELTGPDEDTFTVTFHVTITQ